MVWWFQLCDTPVSYVTFSFSCILTETPRQQEAQSGEMTKGLLVVICLESVAPVVVLFTVLKLSKADRMISCPPLTKHTAANNSKTRAFVLMKKMHQINFWKALYREKNKLHTLINKQWTETMSTSVVWLTFWLIISSQELFEFTQSLYFLHAGVFCSLPERQIQQW